MNNFQNMVNRIKYLANMNIAEKRVPQDGAIRWQSPLVDIRISTMPTAYGEKCVIRILVSQQLTADFSALGMLLNCKNNFLEILRKNSGLILVTGPTGSGKSTTLYTSLHHLNNSQKNIITIEDPIEYMIEGINQMQIHEQRGVTFHSSLRSILRQDPDVIMIGEIRDKETADIAIRASLTGHLILSTLHTNDSISALYRLLDMGVEPYLAVQGIAAIISQRLVRKLCTECKGKGCESCYFTGYIGRTGVFELLTIDSELTELITSKSNARTIRASLEKNNWEDMLNHARKLKEMGVIDEREFQELYYSVT